MVHFTEHVCGTPPPCQGYVTTIGGTARIESFCKFPFFYKGVRYEEYDCSPVDNEVPWCFTINGGWGNCVEFYCGTIPTQPPTSPSTTITTTVTTSLPSTTPECDGYVPTSGGTIGNSTCAFPFTYRDVVYEAYECSTVNSGGLPWCYTDDPPRSNGRKHWGYCLGWSLYRI